MLVYMETGDDCSLEIGQTEQVRFQGAVEGMVRVMENLSSIKKSMFPFGVWLGSLYRRETSDTTKTWCQMGVLAHYVAKLILGARPT